MDRLPAIVIEFFGSPGSGKSYIAKLCEPMLLDADRSVKSPTASITRLPSGFRSAAKVFWAALFGLRHPVRAMMLVITVARLSQHSKRDLYSAVLNLLYLSGLRHRYARRAQIVLFDQGFAQALVSVLYAAKSDTIESLAALLPRPDMVVSVNASSEVALQRLTSRRTRQSRVETGGIEALQRAKRCEEIVRGMDWFKATRTHVTIENNGSQEELERNMEALMVEINQL